MKRLELAVVMVVVCHVILIDQSEAMFGLCSTNWMSDDKCFDNNEECEQLGGKCYHDGHGDHGEGCECKMKISDGSGFKWKVLEKHHIPLVPAQPIGKAPTQPIGEGPAKQTKIGKTVKNQ